MSLAATIVWLSIGLGDTLRAIEDRVIQFARAAATRHSPAVDEQLRELLGDDEQWTLLRRMPAYDRRHHLRVWQQLYLAGYRDPDLLRAALLHDAGKADERGRVMLGHRVVRVLSRRFAPGALVWAIARDVPLLSHGLYLAEHHARLGARLAADAGASERCCILIAAHEQAPSAADPLLKALIIADREAHR